MSRVVNRGLLHFTDQTQPDITFFGEDLPDEFGHRLVLQDRQLADLVIVIGTSLKVAPVAEVPGVLPPNVPQIFISRAVSWGEVDMIFHILTLVA